MLELLEKIQAFIAKESSAIEEACELSGQLDTLCEQKELFKAKINAVTADTVEDQVWL
jgi:hypothetical protein